MRIPEAGGRRLNQEIEFGFGSAVRAVWLQVGNAVFFSRGASPFPFSLFPFRFRAITCPFSLVPVISQKVAAVDVAGLVSDAPSNVFQDLFLFMCLLMSSNILILIVEA